MPNRIIKESILTSENLSEISSEAENLFYRLMVACDDFGIYYAAPSLIRSKCFPWKIDKIKDKDIEKWMKELCDAELIFVYSFESKDYLKFTKWEDHQSVRAAKSKFITPDTDGIQLKSFASNCNQECANVPVFVFDNSIRNSNSNRESVDKSPLEKSIDDFKIMRKQIKKPLTKRAEELLMKELEKLAPGNDDLKMRIIEQSIVRSWAGVFPLKEDGYGNLGKQNFGNNGRSTGNEGKFDFMDKDVNFVRDMQG